MTDLDAVSVALGKLTAEAEASHNQRTLLFEKMDETHKMVSDLTSTLQTHIVAEDIKFHEIERDVSSHSTAIGDLKKFKQRMLIGIAAIGGTGGIIGGLTTGIATKLGL